MKITKDMIRELPKFPEWKLFVHAFPAWMPEDHVWPTSQGQRVMFTYLERSSNGSDGERDR
jgi:hypothetical protein